MIAYDLPVFSRGKKTLVAHPTFISSIPASTALSDRCPLDAPEEVEGIALETLFLQGLIGFNRSMHLGYTIYHWRNRPAAKRIYSLRSRGLWAFEIKRTAKVLISLLSGMESFLTDYPMSRTWYTWATGGCMKTA